MALFSFEEGFEGGNKGAFDGTESDSGARLDFPGPAQLAEDGYGVAPHRGAYCMRVDLEKNTTDAYVVADTGFDIAADGSLYGRFEFLLSPDFACGNDGDEVDIFALIATATEEAVLSVARVDPDGVVLALRETGAGTNFPYVKCPIGVWNCVEWFADIDNAGNNDGSVTVWFNGAKLRITNLDQGAITSARYGAMGQGGNFSGSIYFDDIYANTSRLYPMDGPADMNADLDGETLVMTKSGWAFCGPGSVSQLQMIAGSGATGIAKLYDTAELTRSLHQLKDQITAAQGTIAYSEHQGVSYNSGCYVELSGTDAMALVRVGKAKEFNYGSDVSGMESSAPVE